MAQGLVPGWEIWRNVTLPFLSSYSKFGLLLSKKTEERRAEKFVKSLSIVTASVDTKTDELSGGNAQKVVLAKWFDESVHVVLLDEPTAGVDVGAKRVFKSSFACWRIRVGRGVSGLGVPRVAARCRSDFGHLSRNRHRRETFEQNERRRAHASRERPLSKIGKESTMIVTEASLMTVLEQDSPSRARAWTGSSSTTSSCEGWALVRADSYSGGCFNFDCARWTSPSFLSVVQCEQPLGPVRVRWHVGREHDGSSHHRELRPLRGGDCGISRAIGLTVANHAGPVMGLVAAILAGIGVGFLNGTVVQLVGVNSFIATLGTLTALEGALLVVTNGNTILAGPQAGTFGGLGTESWSVNRWAVVVLGALLILWVARVGLSP